MHRTPWRLLSSQPYYNMPAYSPGGNLTKEIHRLQPTIPTAINLKTAIGDVLLKKGEATKLSVPE